MKALQLESPLVWKTIEIPEPPLPGPEDVLFRVHRMGVCGTDLGGYLGKMPFFSYPRIPGHELGVEVIEVGSRVTHLQPGDRCAVEPYMNCQTCYACRRGFTNCCEHNQTLGVMCDGGLTSRMVLPGRKLHRANALTYDQAALVETLAIGCHAVNRGAARPGEYVLILGAGPIGLSALEFVKLSGATPIVADISESRLRFVRETMGVRHTLRIQGDASDIEQMASITNNQLADLVIDATGNNRSMTRAFEFTSFAGRIVYVGITQQTLEFPQAPLVHRRELTILASRNAVSGDFTRLAALIEDGKIDTAPWITHHAAFDEVPDIFPRWVEPETGVIKAMIDIT